MESGRKLTGASYTPYALSPMEYWYDADGYYVPRSKGVQPQKTKTPPIIWLAHGMDKTTAQAIDKLSIADMKCITQDEYQRG